jgi:glutaredoxin 3
MWNPWNVSDPRQLPERLAKMPVEIYTTPYCPFCIEAKALLQRKGVAYTEIDVGRHRERRSEMVERAQGRVTVPQIFIGATHVGGCDDLYALNNAGKLDLLLVEGQGG